MDKATAQHTPGPWTLTADGGRRPHTVRGQDDELVAGTYWDEHMEGDELANARLIAAAPRLLEALRRLLDEGSYDDNGDYVLLRPGDEDQQEDYEDAPAIANARAILREHGPDDSIGLGSGSLCTLHAAAPALLAALEDSAQLFDDAIHGRRPSINQLEWAKRARAAIRAAKGE